MPWETQVEAAPTSTVAPLYCHGRQILRQDAEVAEGRAAE